jgi:hypothetical protein
VLGLGNSAAIAGAFAAEHILRFVKPRVSGMMALKGKRLAEKGERSVDFIVVTLNVK